MLRTNLSTRPFYNEWAVHLVLAVAAALVLALTAFNASQIMVLSRRRSELNARATAAETESRQLRAAAVKIRQSVDATRMNATSAAAREANALMSRRLFSWTDLFNRLETTLPGDVRITSIRPRIDRDGGLTVTVGVIGRRVEDIDQFMENLEATGTFVDILSREESATEEGLLVAVLEGRYLPARGQAAAEGKQ